MCRDCVVRLTRQFNENTAELAGVPDSGFAESSDAAVLWERFDTALQRNFFLHGFEVKILEDSESINTSWKADSADRPRTRVDEEVALVKAFLERNGYHEVTVVVGIDTELAATGELGRLYAKPDPDDPHWTARIDFERDGRPPLISVGPQ